VRLDTEEQSLHILELLKFYIDNPLIATKYFFLK